MTELELNIVGGSPRGLDLQPLIKTVQALIKLDAAWLKPGIVNLKLVDDDTIRAFNKDYSGNDYATDVLSFSYIGSGGGERLVSEDRQELGDMLVSLQTAERQAREAGVGLSEELATLVLHGVLHILGFDHAGVEDREEMDQLQATILKQAKVRYRNFNWVYNA